MPNISLWEELTKYKKSYPSLENDFECDVAIIGGGITGVTAAFALRDSGKKVILLEKNFIGGSTTGYSTGNLYIATQSFYQTIESKFDKETAAKVAHARKETIDSIERNVNEYKIDCDFVRRPWYLYSESEENADKVSKEVETIKNFGMQIDYISELPIPVKFKKAAVMPGQARFNPWKYTAGLAKLGAKAGIRIYEMTEVSEIEEIDDKIELRSGEFSIKAKYVIHATHTPKGVNILQSLAAPYRSYVVAAKVKEKIPDGNFWDIKEPHHVTSTHRSIHTKDIDLLMVAGSHHKVGQAQPEEKDHYAELENFIYKHYEPVEFPYRWSAQHYQAADGVPYIGRSISSENEFVATGFFADGLVYGPLAGNIIADMIEGNKNKYTEVFNPSRFTPIASAKGFLKENINELGQYAKYITGVIEADSLNDIGLGEGKLIDIDGERCGAYKDEEGKMHIVSAVCPHMKCIVSFNSAEKTWDCPCHGSRFTITGDVIEGPALKGLERKS